MPNIVAESANSELFPASQMWELTDWGMIKIWFAAALTDTHLNKSTT